MTDHLAWGGVEGLRREIQALDQDPSNLPGSVKWWEREAKAWQMHYLMVQESLVEALDALRESRSRFAIGGGPTGRAGDDVKARREVDRVLKKYERREPK